jgi:hypothetical protein
MAACTEGPDCQDQERRKKCCACQKQMPAAAPARIELYDTVFGWMPNWTHQRTGRWAVRRNISAMGRRDLG